MHTLQADRLHFSSFVLRPVTVSTAFPPCWKRTSSPRTQVWMKKFFDVGRLLTGSIACRTSVDMKIYAEKPV